MRALQVGKSPRIFLDDSSVLDIGACIVDGVNLAPGRAIPDDGDPRIDHSLEGMMFTCGPDHIRHPQPVEGETSGRKYPLHGSFSSHPAKIISWTESEGNAEVVAEVPLELANGGSALLERRWSVDGQNGEISLDDKITNTGEGAFPTFHMYHMNIAAKLFDDAVKLESNMLDNDGFGWRFGDEPGSVFCVPAKQSETGWAQLRLGPIAAISNRNLTVRFRTDTLPYLQMWRNQKDPANVLGIEPVSHRWVDRSELKAAGEFIMLEPGQSRSYSIRFSIA